MRPPTLNAAAAFSVLLLLAAPPASADRERPGILRGIIDGIAPGSAEELEAEARAVEDGDEALRLYSLLQTRHADRPEGVRAAIWIGLWAYSGGDFEAALESFEKARRNADDPDLRQRADFWCEQVRFMLGGEPLAGMEQDAGDGLYGVLRRLVRADRAIRSGRRGDAEVSLLALEGESRRSGVLPLLAIRWRDAVSLPGGGRSSRESIGPLLAALEGLPEQVLLAEKGEPPAAPAEGEVWSIQFGVFLDEENAAQEAGRLKESGYDARLDPIEVDGRTRLHLRVGSFGSRAEAESLAATLAEQTDPPPLIVQVR